MKSTGIIRRIDELGRVVIPMEIRRTLNLKDGTEIEIYTSDESLILQKHSSMQNLETLAFQTASVLRDILGLDTLVVDTEKVVVANSVCRNMTGKKLSTRIVDALNGRKGKIYGDDKGEIVEGEELRYISIALAPVIVSGDLIGGIICFSTKYTISESDLKSIKVLADYLAKQLEF